MSRGSDWCGVIVELTADIGFTYRDVHFTIRDMAAKRPMTALVRSASLTRFADVAAAVRPRRPRIGGSRWGCRDALSNDPDLMLPAWTVGRVLELAAERAKEPAFGLRMAESRRLSNLGPLGLLTRDEPTLRSALEALVRHIHVHNEAMVVHVEEASNLVVIRLELIAEGEGPVRQATELVVAVTFRVLRIFHGAELASAAGVLLARSAAEPGGAPPRLRPGGGVRPRVQRHRLQRGRPGRAQPRRRSGDGALHPAPSGSQPDAPVDKDVDRVRQIVVLLLPRGTAGWIWWRSTSASTVARWRAG